MAQGEGREGLRHRLPGARPPARHRHRRAAQRPARAGGGGRVPRADGPRGHRRLPALGALPSPPAGQWHRRLRERRRPDRRGHRQALHVRRVPLALDPGRRLHRAPGRNDRSHGGLPHRARGLGLMEVRRLDDAKPYEGPKHFDVSALRLQGFDASSAQSFWVGLSHFLPGGGAEMDATPLEKVYVVVDGEVTIVTEEGDTTLHPFDSCWIGPNEARAIENRTNRPASMLVVMPYPEGAR